MSGCFWFCHPSQSMKQRGHSNKCYKSNSLHWVLKYARIFVRRHYLLREANKFPRTKLEEHCEVQGTDNVQKQIYEYIVKLNGGYCVFYPSKFLATRELEIISRIFPFLAGTR